MTKTVQRPSLPLRSGLSSFLLPWGCCDLHFQKPEAQGTWGTVLTAVLIIAWVIAERPQSSDALMEAELESESKRITELAEHFRISEESATYADEIRPRLRETVHACRKWQAPWPKR